MTTTRQLVIVLPENTSENAMGESGLYNPYALATFLEKKFVHLAEVDARYGKCECSFIQGTEEVMRGNYSIGDILVFFGEEYRTFADNLMGDLVGVRIFLISDELPKNQVVTLLPDWVTNAVNPDSILGEVAKRIEIPQPAC